MSEFPPTPEQEAILAAATGSNDNLLISALAGAAKTSTLVLLAEALPIKTLAISFNKRIADEMKTRLPAHVESKTLNSLGYSTWTANMGRRAEVDPGKNYRLVKEAIEETINPKEKSALYERMADLIRNVGFMKTCGYIPDNFTGTVAAGPAKPLFHDGEMLGHFEEELTDDEWALLSRVYERGLNEALGQRQQLAGKMILDFDDQLLMPTVFPVSFASPPLVMVDEAQDLSALNHVMLHKVARRRLIAVGDECQSIYGFRGAHEESMSLLEQSFHMHRLILSVSFRCPISVVEAARWRAPHMQYPTWAKPGEVRHWAWWSVEDLPDDAVILCRNNSPLFSMAIKLLKNGRYPELIGNDIGKLLVKWLKKLGPSSMSRADTLVAIDKWEEEKMKKSRTPAKVTDQADCLRIFAEEGKTLGDAVAYAEHIMSVAGPVKLMTGHKSKGLEFDNVFILNEELIGDDPQDKNLRYVMQTRSKSTLTYIMGEFLRGKDDDHETE